MEEIIMEFDEQYLTWIKEEFEKIQFSNDYAQEEKIEDMLIS